MTNMSVDKLNERLNSGKIESGQVIDVRGKGEYKSGHVPGAINIPVGKIKKFYNEKMPQGKTYYIICQSGGRSQKACGILEGLGYKVYNITGGTSAYSYKFPIEK